MQYILNLGQNINLLLIFVTYWGINIKIFKSLHHLYLNLQFKFKSFKTISVKYIQTSCCGLIYVLIIWLRVRLWTCCGFKSWELYYWGLYPTSTNIYYNSCQFLVVNKNTAQRCIAINMKSIFLQRDIQAIIHNKQNIDKELS